ncbi:hypothetical protein AXF42_Ash002153 [Apostasia shenzhenica]|uniref:Uncharacterized protein n=1 Tax=Apostasia shenzhenica TaxID=1088818 RepID=A0A2I0AMR0_9ASPA|nr:hypothetical protein AXF42_Ash002153 [Apostasia shenzhenica]
MNENDDSRRVDLDLLEQKRQLAALKRLEHKRRVKRYFNRKVNSRDFIQGDLVLKRRLLASNNLGVPKLEQTEKVLTSCARLQDLTRTIL